MKLIKNTSSILMMGLLVVLILGGCATKDSPKTNNATDTGVSVEQQKVVPKPEIVSQTGIISQTGVAPEQINQPQVIQKSKVVSPPVVKHPMIIGKSNVTPMPQTPQPVVKTNPPVVVVPNNNTAIVRDEHGCLINSGDAWCGLLEKCYRPGAESCELKDEHGCVTSNGNFWCDKQQKCYDPKTEICDMTKIYCTDAQKNATSCGRFTSPICGWMVDNGKCTNALCILSFSNPCSACMNPNLKYYTTGSCPQQKLYQK